MPIHIKNPETEDLAREISRTTGESLTQAITTALQERLERLKGRRRSRLAQEKLSLILHRVDQLSTLDDRTADDILGYNQHGVPE
ncbi:MAG TPA: type II toxin-antitoxin system VapB family antitoxin [Candidatus Angelobacter sp.]|nr:type II toxin-antitoxin system VapB family antitoxin [Candidatus Angelobacter sp.]